MLALTFDDGPDPVWTPPLLDLLAALDARASFFVIAPRAASQPALIERIRADGHTIGLHCSEHVRHHRRDRAWLQADTRDALHLLETVGARPSLWRAPWGEPAPWTGAVAHEHGLQMVGWTIDTHDWRGDSAERMLAATGAALTPGAIVLAHDGIGPGARRDNSAETIRYTRLAIERGRELGLEPGAL